jgi:RNA polymerase sigma-70 factor (ECF subfamily)
VVGRSERVLDELLVLRCQDGEANAFEELVGRWQRKLLRHALHLTGDADGANDVVQEAWFAIVRGIGRIDDPARFPAWAYRIVTHKAADWVRKRQRRQAVEDALEPPRPTAVPEGANDDVDALRAALRNLPRDARGVLSLHYLDGLGVRDIARALGIPAGTVKSRLFNARNKLKQVLERKEVS